MSRPIVVTQWHVISEHEQDVRTALETKGFTAMGSSYQRADDLVRTSEWEKPIAISVRTDVDVRSLGERTLITVKVHAAPRARIVGKAHNLECRRAAKTAAHDTATTMSALIRAESILHREGRLDVARLERSLDR